jgi:hypothetical protein
VPEVVDKAAEVTGRDPARIVTRQEGAARWLFSPLAGAPMGPGPSGFGPVFISGAADRRAAIGPYFAQEQRPRGISAAAEKCPRFLSQKS